MKDVAAFKIAFLADIKIALCDWREFLAKSRFDLGRGPDEEFSFLALTVGILGRIETMVRARHLAQHVVEDLARDVKEFGFVQRTSGIEIKPRELCVVVEHFLEMRHQPAIVNAVAM